MAREELGPKMQITTPLVSQTNELMVLLWEAALIPSFSLLFISLHQIL